MGRSRALAQREQVSKPRHARQHEVDDRDVGGHAREERDADLAGRGVVDVEALALEDEGEGRCGCGRRPRRSRCAARRASSSSHRLVRSAVRATGSSVAWAVVSRPGTERPVASRRLRAHAARRGRARPRPCARTQADVAGVRRVGARARPRRPRGRDAPRPARVPDAFMIEPARRARRSRAGARRCAATSPGSSSAAAIEESPALRLSAPRPNERLPRIVVREQLDTLLDDDWGEDEWAVRDRAVCEVLYGAGLRVSELCDARRRRASTSPAGCCASWARARKERVVPAARPGAGRACACGSRTRARTW